MKMAWLASQHVYHWISDYSWEHTSYSLWFWYEYIYIYEYYIKDTGHIESPFPMILMVLESNHIPNIVC